MDAGTIIAIVLLIVAAVVAVNMIRKRAKGDTGCGCGCSGCDTSLSILRGEDVSNDGDAPCCCCGNVPEPKITETKNS